MAASVYRGADAAIKDLEGIIRLTPNIFATALFQEAQVEVKEVKLRTPVKTGALRASIILIGPNRQGRRIWVIIQAGGPTVTYAFIVHYDLEAFHKHGEALFIENPLRESLPHFPNRVAARINSNRVFL
ncbi:hypothetical protein LCGC14_2450990 [marine sediment metagenome]|uniref:Uncharacterized protein n=1 Tax=marine sediment metagenome TaxID=412755 RepID=A0A0F9EA05_9ZZZZ